MVPTFKRLNRHDATGEKLSAGKLSANGVDDLLLLELRFRSCDRSLGSTALTTELGSSLVDADANSVISGVDSSSLIGSNAYAYSSRIVPDREAVGNTSGSTESAASDIATVDCSGSPPVVDAAVSTSGAIPPPNPTRPPPLPLQPRPDVTLPRALAFARPPRVGIQVCSTKSAGYFPHRGQSVPLVGFGSCRTRSPQPEPHPPLNRIQNPEVHQPHCRSRRSPSRCSKVEAASSRTSIDDLAVGRSEHHLRPSPDNAVASPGSSRCDALGTKPFSGLRPLTAGRQEHHPIRRNNTRAEIRNGDVIRLCR